MNRNQRFVPLTEKDKAAFDGLVAAKKYSYPRKRGNMLLNYSSINNEDWKNLYFQKNVYYAQFEEERKYKDVYKKRNVNFRSYEEMKEDIDRQHRYFTRPLMSTTDDGDDTLHLMMMMIIDFLCFV